MPLPLPNLDDRSYADLLDEARALITAVDPAWTDHNPSDPGIALVELLAWLTEQLIYRVDQLPPASELAFLRLLNGDAWQPPAPLNQERLARARRETLLALRERSRAATLADYEQLATGIWPQTAEARALGVQRLRARAVPRRNLAVPGGANVEAPAHISLIVVPELETPAAGPPTPGEPLCKALWRFFDKRRMVTTRHHVVGPAYAPLRAEILIARRADARDEQVRSAVNERLGRFLDPLRGGADGKGWPFGQSIYLSDLYALVEAVPGVEYIPEISLVPGGAEPATELLHPDGSPIGLGLSTHQLPWATLNATDIVVAPTFLPLRIGIRAGLSDGEETATRRAVALAARRVVHPLYGLKEQQWREAPWSVTREAFVAAVKATPGIDPESVGVLLDFTPGGEAANFPAGVLAELRLTLDLRGVES